MISREMMSILGRICGYSLHNIIYMLLYFCCDYIFDVSPLPISGSLCGPRLWRPAGGLPLVPQFPVLA